MLFSEAMGHVRAIMFKMGGGRKFTYAVGNDIISFDGQSVMVNDLIVAKQFIGKNNGHWLIYDSPFDSKCHFVSDFGNMLKLYIVHFVEKTLKENVIYTDFLINDYMFDFATEKFDRP